MLLPYFDGNIFMNYNADDKSIGYLKHKVCDDNEAIYELWREQGIPDVMIGECKLDKVYNESEYMEKYARVAIFHYNILFKFTYSEKTVTVYIRKDLLKDYPNLKEIPY
jgi:hypothetical protein